MVREDTNQGKRVPSAMEAGLIKRVMTLEDIANLVPDEAPKTRGNYKKKII